MKTKPNQKTLNRIKFGVFLLTLIDSGCSTVRLVCMVWDHEVAGSNPAIPTENCYDG